MMMMIIFRLIVKSKKAFRAITKVDIFQPYISDDNFRTSNVRADDVCYDLYVFDKRYQQNFIASQQIKRDFNFDGIVSNDNNGNVLVLTKRLISIRSDGQRHFDLIKVIFIFFFSSLFL